jgi:hypothetical protein
MLPLRMVSAPGAASPKVSCASKVMRTVCGTSSTTAPTFTRPPTAATLQRTSPLSTVHGSKAMHCAARDPARWHGRLGQRDCLELLMEHDADTHAPGHTTPAIAAAQHGRLTPSDCIAHGSHTGHVDCLRLLLRSGAAVDARDRQGYTASHLAAMNGFRTPPSTADRGSEQQRAVDRPLGVLAAPSRLRSRCGYARG